MRRFVFLAMACISLHAQSPEFEVASIKPATGVVRHHGPGGPGTSDPGQIELANYSLRDLVYRAFDVMPYQLSVPLWMEDGERFDVVAKLPASAGASDVPLMLQKLLEERFHLRVRHELRDTAAYALTQGAGGSRMKAYPELLPDNFIDAPRIAGIDRDGAYIVAPGYVTAILASHDGISTISVAREPVRDLCKMLSRVLQKPVADQTGLKGRYDVRLHFAPYQASLSAPGDGIGVEAAANEPEVAAPTVFEAVQSQIGLRLEPKRLPVEFLVVVHADRNPSEN